MLAQTKHSLRLKKSPGFSQRFFIEQAVILAAGKSTRTYPLTLTTPKPLLKVGNKTLLEYNLDQLNGLVKEVIIVVGYKKSMLKKR